MAVAAAASGALAMPSAAGSTSASETLDAVPELPTTSGTTTADAAAGALDSISAAGASLTAETSATAEVAHSVLVEQQRVAAAEAAARAEREAKIWVLPVTDYRITAGFGQGGAMWSNDHTGTDFAADYGAEVMAISSGTVIFAGWDGSYGNSVIIEHWDGTQSRYAHLSGFEGEVTEGLEVLPNQVIGYVGSTGNSTGNHLHLEIMPNGGSAVNPVPWFAEHGLNV